MVNVHEKSISATISIMFLSTFLSTAPSSVEVAGAFQSPQALITNVLNAAHAAGWSIPAQTSSVDQSSPKPSETQSSPSLRPLTNETLQKMIRKNQETGADRLLSSTVVISLSLDPAGNEILTRQLGYTWSDPQKVFFYQSLKFDGYVFSAKTKDGMFAYYVDKDLKLISAASRPNGESAFKPRDLNVAKSDLPVIFDTWANIMDAQQVVSNP